MNREELLANLPDEIRGQLLEEYDKAVRNYRESRWEMAILSAGKLCEIVYTIINGHLNGLIPARHSTGPSNMLLACQGLEALPSSHGRSLRIQVPRTLLAIYEIRNNRGVGHAGGDVDPNHMDATFVIGSVRWIIAELIRNFHNVDTAEANKAVELLTERELPIIWTIGDQKRILDPSLSKSNQTLLLLYAVSSVTDAELCGWVEYSNLSVFKNKVLVPGHKSRLWEYDSKNRLVTLSEKGSIAAEKLLKQ